MCGALEPVIHDLAPNAGSRSLYGRPDASAPRSHLEPMDERRRGPRTASAPHGARSASPPQSARIRGTFRQSADPPSYRSADSSGRSP